MTKPFQKFIHLILIVSLIVQEALWAVCDSQILTDELNAKIKKNLFVESMQDYHSARGWSFGASFAGQVHKDGSVSVGLSGTPSFGATNKESKVTRDGKAEFKGTSSEKIDVGGKRVEIHPEDEKSGYSFNIESVAFEDLKRVSAVIVKAKEKIQTYFEEKSLRKDIATQLEQAGVDAALIDKILKSPQIKIALQWAQKILQNVQAQTAEQKSPNISNSGIDRTLEDLQAKLASFNNMDIPGFDAVVNDLMDFYDKSKTGGKYDRANDLVDALGFVLVEMAQDIADAMVAADRLNKKGENANPNNAQDRADYYAVMEAFEYLPKVGPAATIGAQEAGKVWGYKTEDEVKFERVVMGATFAAAKTAKKVGNIVKKAFDKVQILKDMQHAGREALLAALLNKGGLKPQYAYATAHKGQGFARKGARYDNGAQTFFRKNTQSPSSSSSPTPNAGRPLQQVPTTNAGQNKGKEKIIDKRHDNIAHGGYYGDKEKRKKAYEHQVRINNAQADPYIKHTKAKTEADAKLFSETGNRHAQYLPDIDNIKLEKITLKNGTLVKKSDSVEYYVLKHNKVVGYNEGQPTQWIRAEITSGNVYHGHPISEETAMKYLNKVKK